MIARKSPNEEHRLAALHRYAILDTPPEPAFDDITRLVATLCDAPIAVINLIDRERQWFKSEIGLGVRETPLDISICAHAILQPGLFVVPDTLEDERFRDNPLVTGDPRLRFYAGALLETSDGHALGTLCVLDYQPRTLSETQGDALHVLARQVMAELELRRLYAREKHVTETLQRAMLMTPTIGSALGLEIATFYEAAWDEARVGGDFFDAVTLAGDRVALVVGDVSGKGLAAAVHTAHAKFALRVFLRESSSPADALTRLNDYLIETAQADQVAEGTFIALSLAVMDASGGVACASAGMEAPIISRSGGGFDAPFKGGPLLGLASGFSCPVHVSCLAAGDMLMMVTDGLTEARRKRRFLGREGALRLLEDNITLPSLTDIGLAVLDGGKAFSDGPLRDDVCLLLARRLNPCR